MTLKYHVPDSTWEAWDCDTFEKYLDKFLVQGKFHKNVPEDIVKSYKLVEHLIAHAWYCYPAMDDAFSKALLIVEMGVKMRCLQLGLPVTKKKINGGVFESRLSDLISEIKKAEPDKNIDVLLNWARLNRNNMAHSSNYSFGVGAMVNFHAIVSALNLLFLSNNTVKEQITESQRVQEILNDNFGNGLIVEINNKSIVCNNVKILYSIKVAENWNYLIAISALDWDSQTNGIKGTEIKLIGFTARNIQYSRDSVEFLTDSESEKITIKVNRQLAGTWPNVESRKTIKNLIKDVDLLSSIQKIEFQNELKFKYKYLCVAST